ncbi:glycosyltransferase [Nakamurella deserti]|uniref:glycosyltransferase n=1 Tax=Nakamurella deserti TaxID=2164074 RepID=UPI00147883A9|nr:glycosyltransferase [Nakamurella deserti]
MTRRSPGRVSRLASTAVLGFLGLKTATLAANLALFPTVRTRPGDRAPGAALLVPVRDEASRLPDTLPGLLAAGASEIVFLDDGSTDGTAALIERTVDGMRSAGTLPGSVSVRVVTGAPRPAGWAGKTWACAQLADATDAELLVYCDADVRLAPGAVPAVVAEMSRQGADVFSVFPRQLVGGWSERLLAPLITDVVLCFLPFPLLAVPVPAARSAATAQGALLAFSRSGYRRLGGFAAVRAEVVEDVAVARRARRLDLRLGLALGGDAVRVRMYRTHAEVVAGFGRGLTPVTGGRRWLVAVGLAWHLLAYTAPPLLARSRRWRVAALLGIVERVLVEGKTGGRDWPAAALVSAAPVAAVPVVRQALRREQIWKGRRYS